MAGKLYKPRAKSFWLVVRCLLCRKTHRQHAAAAQEEDGDKRSLLGRSSSLEELLGSDSGAAVRQCASPRYCAEKDGQHAPLPGLQRPEATAVSAAGGGAPLQYRRFMFGGLRRRLMMRRPWRPMLVAIPE